ncbi:MAG: dynamin family protein [Porphyromonas somerae]|uniref:dynamin family protein n=1 Tax=Porphyromonas somerae TaxID=322095 RepID=UPI0026EF592E|nr:dynamin family protein [Porphyromonas somerae]MDD7557799.1 dynamin family protein [Porphyromonas somerae]MDY3885394.1 dynamin family protein [Porphyromonas somerae]MDY5816035.1 dynamin family protein [Porphyromonas somerae]
MKTSGEELNLFEEFQKKKESLRGLIAKAREFGWIDDDRVTSMNDKLDNDILTIGVIGQMKCGKSTFLNSFVFEDTILPAATTPMTAALSIITYGEEKKIVAEFYTVDEWTEQTIQASRSLEDAEGNSLEESKIKAAKELVGKSSKLGGSLSNYLGKSKEDSFENLEEYVGADGKYVSITKAVKIYYPKEYLKGVEIVDTPGFNDPIVSREERTKEFLKKADVVLMMLYAGRPFDATDRDIIFKNVAECGIGKVLVGINKYDIPYCNEVNPEDENQIKAYVKSEINKACRESYNSILSQILEEVEPIPLSAEMALLSELPFSKISESDALNFAWNRHCKGFGISTQQEMRKWSKIDDLIASVKEVIEKDKIEILISKPLNAIRARGTELKQSKENAISLTSSEVENYKVPDYILEEKLNNIKRAERKLNRQCDILLRDLNTAVEIFTHNSYEDIEDVIERTRKNMIKYVDDNLGRFTKLENLIDPLNDILNSIKRELRKPIIGQLGRCKVQLMEHISDALNNSNEIIIKYLPEFDRKDFFDDMNGNVKFKYDGLYELENLEVDHLVPSLKDGNFFLTFRAIHNTKNKIAIKDEITKLSKDMEQKSRALVDSVFSDSDRIVEEIRKMVVDEMVTPLKDQVIEIQSGVDDKEARLAKAEQTLAELKKERAVLESQIAEVETFII